MKTVSAAIALPVSAVLLTWAGSSAAPRPDSSPWPAYLAYGATKAALAHLVVGLAKALAPDVLVNGVAPGTVLPPVDVDDAFLEAERQRTLVGRLGSPEDVADAVAFLAASDFTTGQILAVDGGKSRR